MIILNINIFHAHYTVLEAENKEHTHTHRHTDRPSTVTLAVHACGGLIIKKLLQST